MYVAGPMRGISQFNFAAFDCARDLLRSKGYQVISPADLDRANGFDGTSPHEPSAAELNQMIGRDLDAIRTCTHIALLPGWEKSSGVAVELPLARFLGLKVLDATTGLPYTYGDEMETPSDPGYDLGSKPSNPKDLIGSTKVPLGLFPTTAIAAGCMAFHEGMCKYGRMNWRVVGVRASIYYDAMLRHLQAWWEGEDIDPDSGLSHLAKAIACNAVLIDAMAAGKLTDDRATAGGYGKMMSDLQPLVEEIKQRHADKHPRHYTIQDKE